MFKDVDVYCYKYVLVMLVCVLNILKINGIKVVKVEINNVCRMDIRYEICIEVSEFF